MEDEITILEMVRLCDRRYLAQLIFAKSVKVGQCFNTCCEIIFQIIFLDPPQGHPSFSLLMQQLG
jgi:hypothetical protein